MLGYAAKRNAVIEKREAILERADSLAINPYIPTIAPKRYIAARQATNGVQYAVSVQCTATTTCFRTITTTSTTSTLSSTAPTPTS